MYHLVCITLWNQACRSMFPKQLVVVRLLSHIRLWATSWTVAHQAPLSMGFSRQECWSGLPFPPSGNLPNPRIEPVPLMSPALRGRFFTTSATWKVLKYSFAVNLNCILEKACKKNLQEEIHPHTYTPAFPLGGQLLRSYSLKPWGGLMIVTRGFISREEKIPWSFAEEVYMLPKVSLQPL